jgi:hypothetical protein
MNCTNEVYCYRLFVKNVKDKNGYWYQEVWASKGNMNFTLRIGLFGDLLFRTGQSVGDIHIHVENYKMEYTELWANSLSDAYIRAERKQGDLIVELNRFPLLRTQEWCDKFKEKTKKEGTICLIKLPKRQDYRNKLKKQGILCKYSNGDIVNRNNLG